MAAPLRCHSFLFYFHFPVMTAYLKGMAVIRKNSFVIFPETLSDSFGEEIYSSRKVTQLEGKITEGTPYGWVQGLSLPTRETVKETNQMLFDEMQAV